MSPFLKPTVWLIALIVGLPLFSETAYSPALPDIARSLSTSDSMVEYTLVIYLVAFALGTLVWGNLSDKTGRKPCLLMGLGIYVLGCFLCFFSTSIEALLLSRFIQAFGGSSGSVLGQAISRDAFVGKERGKLYATVGVALACSPAIGPVLGGVIDQYLGWSMIFLILAGVGIGVFTCVLQKLPETRLTTEGSNSALIHTLKILCTDPFVIGSGIVVGGCNGISFSYYAEGSFYLIELLGLSPSIYGISFILIAAAGVVGNLISRKLFDHYSAPEILYQGLIVVLGGTAFFCGMTLIFSIVSVDKNWSIALTLISMFITMVGVGITIPSCLSRALDHYQGVVGTASSLFGFFYYGVISLLTFGMGWLHNGTLLVMPIYFLGIAGTMVLIYRKMIRV